MSTWALPSEAETSSRQATPRPRFRKVLPAGRSVVDVPISAERYASIAVLGPTRALRGMHLVGENLAAVGRRRGSLDEDGQLPRVISLPPWPGPERVRVLVEVVEPSELVLSEVDPAASAWPQAKRVARGEEAPRQLVGLPAPAGIEDGYVLQAPSRYQFARVDVANVLRRAFSETYRRFRRGPIAVADISQLDSDRPATDLGLPRHISHVGGRDVDIALPSSDGLLATVREHCRGVLTDEDRLVCAPGSIKGVDVDRLVYLLGKLIDLSEPGTVTKIYMDEVYLEAMQPRLELFKARRWIEEEAFFALGEEGICVASPWHTDHVHVRWGGEQAPPAFSVSDSLATG